MENDFTKTGERRRHSRVPYGAWVENEEAGGGMGFYLAQNLSLGGLLLQAKGERPAIGSRVRLRLLVENESRVMLVTGEVVRYSDDRDSAEFAVQFTSLDDARQRFLEELVDEIRQRTAATAD